jgi:nucleotide-binding universal stress UspA family protein
MPYANKVVVGIDGSASAVGALDWAAEEAERTGRSLVVVHVGDVEAAEVSADRRAFGRELLDEAITTLVHTHPQLLPATDLLEGVASDVLVDASRSADLLVLGRGRRGISALLLGSVAHHVLAHAHCPTAVVGANARTPENTIVVGVSDSAGGAAALAFACAEAALRGADVLAVRAWSSREYRLAAAAALPVSSPELWERQEAALVDERVAAARRAHPEVEVRTALVASPTEVALEREAEQAAMLVLGCRRADDARLPRLGPISSWAAHHFECPVVIVGTPTPG